MFCGLGVFILFGFLFNLRNLFENMATFFLILVLVNKSIKPSMLLRQLASKQWEFRDKTLDLFFVRKLQRGK